YANPVFHTLSLHDALPIWAARLLPQLQRGVLASLVGSFEQAREPDDGALVHAGHHLAARILHRDLECIQLAVAPGVARGGGDARDRKSTRLNSSHVAISYA